MRPMDSGQEFSLSSSVRPRARDYYLDTKRESV